ncbi:MAG: flavin mononucleotide-binding protein [Winogradskyella sp.]|uniref:pyridoxamine 5'-phosphate oxidase family protein n=1 Tax=Winogradskyella sp. TaxID=1883156 RepID=UPI000F3B7FD8|nr:pyridoxamine 5'-phosphate oxidase family protein [Winogradskyella sp.]RNC87742.1 MAG: flavin mononucleotide-binding protein [Winogradskyella sp.]
MIKNLTKQEISYVLKSHYIGHLAYTYLGKPFVVPITYYYDEKNTTIICYSGEGHKINALRKNNNVALEVSEINSVNNWRSVLVHGQYEELKGSTAKAELHGFSLGVKDLIIKNEQRELNFISEFSSKIYKGEIPIVFKILIEDITGKERIR